MDNRAMYTLSYGLFLLSAQADGFDNASSTPPVR